MSAVTALAWLSSNAGSSPAHLGGGQGIDIPIGRIAVAFLICVIIAALAVLLIRQRSGKSDLADMLRRISPRSVVIEIVEVRRLSTHADIAAIRYDDQELLLLLQHGHAQVLKERWAGRERPAS